MEPLGHDLDGGELVGAGIELVPDRIDMVVGDGLGAGEGGLFHEGGEGGAAGVGGGFRPGTDIDEGRVGAGAVEVAPVRAGHDDEFGIGGDDLLGIDGARVAGEEFGPQIDAAGQLDHLAVIVVAEGAAAIAEARGAVHEDQRLFGIGLGQNIGDAGGLGVPEIDDLLGALLAVEELTEQVQAGLGVFEDVLAEVDIDELDADLVEHLLELDLVGGGLVADGEDHDVRGEVDHGLGLQGAVGEIAQERDVGGRGKASR